MSVGISTTIWSARGRILVGIEHQENYTSCLFQIDHGNHSVVDFRSFPRDGQGFDSAFVTVDRLSKRTVSIPCHSTIGSVVGENAYL